MKAWIGKGNAPWGLKRYQEAEAAYDGATTRNPNDAAAWYNKGLALQQLKRYAEAPAAYEHRFDPRDARDWRGKARRLRALGRTREAEEAERRAQELGG